MTSIKFCRSLQENNTAVDQEATWRHAYVWYSSFCESLSVSFLERVQTEFFTAFPHEEITNALKAWGFSTFPCPLLFRLPFYYLRASPGSAWRSSKVLVLFTQCFQAEDVAEPVPPPVSCSHHDFQSRGCILNDTTQLAPETAAA